MTFINLTDQPEDNKIVRFLINDDNKNYEVRVVKEEDSGMAQFTCHLTNESVVNVVIVTDEGNGNWSRDEPSMPQSLYSKLIKELVNRF